MDPINDFSSNPMSLTPYRYPVPGSRIIHNRYDRFMDMVLTATSRLDSGAYYNEPEARILLRIGALDPGGLALEIGANIGASTLTLALAFHRGTVVAIEPQRLAFQTLCGNLALNGIFNVDAIRAVAGSGDPRNPSTIRVPCYHPRRPHNSGGMTMDPLSPEGDNTPLISLDRIGLPALDLLKIDAEGSEYDILCGAAETLSRFHPALYLEYQWNKQSIVNYLLERGYILFSHQCPYILTPDLPESAHGDLESELNTVSHMLLAVHESRPAAHDLIRAYLSSGEMDARELLSPLCDRAQSIVFGTDTRTECRS